MESAFQKLGFLVSFHPVCIGMKHCFYTPQRPSDHERIHEDHSLSCLPAVRAYLPQLTTTAVPRSKVARNLTQRDGARTGELFDGN